MARLKRGCPRRIADAIAGEDRRAGAPSPTRAAAPSNNPGGFSTERTRARLHHIHAVGGRTTGKIQGKSPENRAQLLAGSQVDAGASTGVEGARDRTCAASILPTS